MSATNFHPVKKEEILAHANGTAAPTLASGAARKRSATRKNRANGATVEAAAGQPELGEFIPANIQPIDAEMWPINPVVWLQTEWKPGLLATSGLRIERSHRVPVPGFLNIEIGRGYRVDGPEDLSSRDLPRILPPHVQITPPQDDHALLGWDPRSIIPVVTPSRTSRATGIPDTDLDAGRLCGEVKV